MNVDIEQLLDETAFVPRLFNKRSKLRSEMIRPTVVEGDAIVGNPVVSILVLTYNHAKYIDECLRSLVAQKSDYAYEIVIAEDLSRDDTLEKCKRWQREYPQLIRLLIPQDNAGGPFENTLRSLPFLHGKYMCVCEGDDFWCDERKLHDQVSYLESNPDCSLVYSCLGTQYEKYRITRCPLSPRTRRFLSSLNGVPRDEFAAQQFVRQTVSTQTSMYRREVFCSQVGTMEKLVSRLGWLPVSDFETFFLMAKQGRCHYVDRVTAVLRMNAGSLTAITDRRIAYGRMVGDSRSALYLNHLMPSLSREQMEFKVVQLLNRYVTLIALSDGAVTVSPYMRDLCGQFKSWLSPAVVCAVEGDESALTRDVMRRRLNLCSERSFWGSLLRRLATAAMRNNLFGGGTAL